MMPNSAGGDHLCGRCLKGGWAFQEARALVAYGEPLAAIMHSFKYRGRREACATFRALLLDTVGSEWPADSDWILPVPLHRRRLRQRGFNQALELARAFFPEQRAKILPAVLERHRPTRPQTTLSGRERRRNLSRAFQVREPDKVKGRKLLLVDDVFTTGTTVNACAKVLSAAGAGEVRVLTLARVLTRG